MHFLTEYGLFLAKILTFLIAFLLAVAGVFAIIRKGKFHESHRLEIKKLNEKFSAFTEQLNATVLTKKAYKKWSKKTKEAEKALSGKQEKKHIYVLQFHGDMKASSVNALREEVTAIISVASPRDEVVVRLESPGGMVSAYGLAASQLQRLRQKQISLTVTVDKIAASGGYLMACVANKILAAPFAIIGSIGVVAQLPNFHRYLKDKNIDFEQVTAGEYKRTLSLFGENTAKGREKLQEDLEEIHHLFKSFIQQNRSHVPIEQVATGEHWLAARALELKLVDELITSDDYLYEASKVADIYQISYMTKKTLGEKLSAALYHAYGNITGILKNKEIM